jgi:hypothetical protein
VARQLAPMISTFIRAQWESGELEDVDDERRQILEEAEELDHIWGVWEAEKELTNALRKWIKGPFCVGIQAYIRSRERVAGDAEVRLEGGRLS